MQASVRISVSSYGATSREPGHDRFVSRGFRTHLDNCADHMPQLLNHGELVVVETETERWVGLVELRADQLVIRSGRAGRPRLVDADEVIRIAPASDLAE